MEQLNQLKTMRDEALDRLQVNPDYKLLNSLDNLIVELEDVITAPRQGLSVVETVSSTEEQVEDVIDQMNAELEDFDDKDEGEEESRVSFN